VRRRLERLALAHEPPSRRQSMAMRVPHIVRKLRELIDALDRRVPQVERAGEASIARDAAALRARAVTRIEELEHDPVHADDV
jgi:hypothetical protein